MTKKTVIGLTYKEVEELEQELNICIDVDMGVVGLWSNEIEEEWDKIFEEVVVAVNKKYNVNIPQNAYLFSNDGDQNFGFFIGFMWKERR